MNGAGGEVAAVFLGAHVGGELDRIAAALKLLAERGRGKEMAARAASGEQDGAGLQATCSVALPVRAAAAFFLARGAARHATGHRPFPRQAEDKAHGQRHGEKRGAAIGDEGQRHALGGEQSDIHRHVDQGLDAEQHDEPGGGVANEPVLLLRCLGQAAQHDESEQQQQNETGDQPILLRRHGKDEVGMRVRKHVLHRALAGAAAEPAAMKKRVERLVGLIGVAGRRIEEAVDARGDMRHEKIGRRDAGEPRRGRALRSRTG